MKQRISERINANIDVKIFCCKETCPGIIRNLSESDMYIDLKSCSEMHSEFKVIIHSIKGPFTVPVKICRLEKRDDNHVCIALTLSEQSEHYTDFVKDLKEISTS